MMRRAHFDNKSAFFYFIFIKSLYYFFVVVVIVMYIIVNIYTRQLALFYISTIQNHHLHGGRGNLCHSPA